MPTLRSGPPKRLDLLSFLRRPDRREGKPLFNMTDDEISAIYDKMIKASAEIGARQANKLGNARDAAHGQGVRAQVFEVIVRQAYGWSALATDLRRSDANQWNFRKRD